MILNVLALTLAVTLLVASAYLAIDRAKLPLLCLGAVGTFSGWIAILAVSTFGIPMVLALALALMAGTAIGLGLHLLIHYLHDGIALAATTLALAGLSTLVPIDVGVIGDGAGLGGMLAGILFVLAACVLVRRFEHSVLGAVLRVADHDAQMAQVLGLEIRNHRGRILVIACAMAGVAGPLLLMGAGVHAPIDGLQLSLALLAIVVMAGPNAPGLAMVAAVPVLIMPRLGVWTIDGFPDLTLAVAALGIALTWILEGKDHRSEPAGPVLE